VKNKKSEASVQTRFLEKLAPLWPALKGSLALVHKPCIRPHCRACASGVKHPNYLLTYTQNGKRRCLYVPGPMVPVLQNALKNGRHIEQLLYQMGPALVQEYRAQNPAPTGPALKVTLPPTQKKRPKS
jgi:hypothetical protein